MTTFVFEVYGDLLSLFVHDDVLTDGSQSLQWFESFFSFKEWHSPFIRQVLSCEKMHSQYNQDNLLLYQKKLCSGFHEVLTLSVHLEFMTSFVIEQSKHLESQTRWRQLLSLKVCPSLLTWIKAPPRDSGSLHDIWFMLIKSPTTVRISVVETTFSSI